MNNTELILNKRRLLDDLPSSSRLPRKKQRVEVVSTAVLHLKPLGLPLVPSPSGASPEPIPLEPYRPYTFGRSRRHCDFVFDDRRVSKRHFQVLFDALNRKIYIVDGVFWLRSTGSSRVRVSLNGLFVNGVRIGRGEVAELGAGDEVLLVCGNERACSLGFKIGFLVQNIVFVEEVCDANAASSLAVAGSGVSSRASFLLGQCRQILYGHDPVLSLRKFITFHRPGRVPELRPCVTSKFPVVSVPELTNGAMNEQSHIPESQNVHVETTQAGSVERTGMCDTVPSNHERVESVHHSVAPIADIVQNGTPKTSHLEPHVLSDGPQFCRGVLNKDRKFPISAPGRKFYLNRLQSVDHGLLDHVPAVSLPELLHPVESLQQIFIATFTSDILWFLSYCEIPAHLPVTIACHNRQRCWSEIPNERFTVPYSDFPNLVVMYPPFPEVIAFGNDRKRSGIACHHPKLFVLQREDSMRVVITSANLCEKQWRRVTNTVWWQDFPRTREPDYLSLFTQLSNHDINQESKSDFAAQLAGFIASLIVDVPSQAHWILELAKYDFTGALGHLVASVPGIHPLIPLPILESVHFLPSKQYSACSHGVKVLGSVDTSLVGLSHLFHTRADSSGSQLKKLASCLGKCHENANGMMEVVLRRNTNIPADINAVSVHVINSGYVSEGDFIQIGFLPRHVARWVAPLSDIGWFSFSGYVRPKEVLTTALEGSTGRVQMTLYVSKGPSFTDIPKILDFEHVSAISMLVASIQRSTGLWRLHEVLCRYKWPEYLESDFVFGASSIGSVNAQFLAAFSAAAGKTSVQLAESEESDPEWGCWSASQEKRCPSVRIVFPTIQRVKTASCGILASKFLLCFSQKTWMRLRNLNILHDAVPYPSDRANHPMHVKVARRRFQSKNGTSFGWVYNGSHNLSAAAWGRPIYRLPGSKTSNGAVKTNPVLGTRLHICNYELGIIFIVPPSDTTNASLKDTNSMDLDDIVLPFAVPAPKYRPNDRPATGQAMREAMAEVRAQGKENFMGGVADAGEEEEVPDEDDEVEEEVIEDTNFLTKEEDDEKAYADKLWSQVDSSQSC